jgi:hypothetical protein
LKKKLNKKKQDWVVEGWKKIYIQLKKIKKSKSNKPPSTWQTLSSSQPELIC